MYPIHTPQLEHQRFDHLIANSHLMRNDLAKCFKIPFEKMTVIYPAYNHHKFTPVGTEERLAIRKRFGLTEKDLVVGLITSGNFKKRGLDIFLKALELLPLEFKSQVKFWLVGKDRPDDFPSGINITQMPVIEDVENYFRVLDIFVLPARVEEFGRVQLEAMACGIPVISTKFVGCSELIGAEGQQFILHELKPELIAEKMIQLLSNSDLRAKLAASASQEAKVASEENLAPKFDQVFLPILNN
jgi:UDP-glucose:(heptosyl)LPS alpha-1,3-glucosyltransferase